MSIRILHLIDPQSADGGPCTARLLADVMRHLQPAEHEALVIGNSHDLETARRCGVESQGALSPPRAVPWAAANLLRRFLNSRRMVGESFDLIHAWTARTAALAVAGNLRRPSLVTLHAGPVADLSFRWSMKTMRGAEDQSVLAASTVVRREYRSQRFVKPIAVLPPAVDPNSSAMIDRALVRQRWAEHSDINIPSDVFVIGLLGEPACSLDVRAAAAIVCRVRLAGRKVRMIIAPDAGTLAARSESMQMIQRLAAESLMVIDDCAGEPWSIVKGLDAALVLGSACREHPASSPLPLLWALAAGVPVVVETSDAMNDIIEDGTGGWLIGPGDVSAAAARILQMIDDPTLAAAAGDSGKQLASDTFHIESYCLRLRHAYELLLADRSVRTLESTPEQTALVADSAAMV